jgi:hypothetical protein
MNQPNYVDPPADDDAADDDDDCVINLRVPRSLRRNLKMEAAAYQCTMRELAMQRLAAGSQLANRRGIY